MKLVEPNEETYALYVDRRNFAVFDLFYTEAGYKIINGEPLKYFKQNYGYFVVDKKSKSIGHMETLIFSTYRDKEYGLEDIIKPDKNETMNDAKKLLPCPFCGNKNIEISKSHFGYSFFDCTVKCNCCNAQISIEDDIYNKNKELVVGKAIKAWNQRV